MTIHLTEDDLKGTPYEGEFPNLSLIYHDKVGNISLLVKNICEHYGCTKSEFTSQNHFNEPKITFCFLAYELFKMGKLEKIGGFLGLNHATIVHHRKNFKNKYQLSAGYRKRMDDFLMRYYSREYAYKLRKYFEDEELKLYGEKSSNMTTNHN